VIENVVEEEPPELLEVTVYPAEAVMERGVPVRLQFVVFRESPAGRLGLTLHDVGAPPVLLGVIVEMAEDFVKVKGALA
jgi:hypothetical protein